jgi:ABC-type sugar transport system permease subunit
MNIEGDLLREPSGEAGQPLPRSAVRAVARTPRRANAGVSERWATHVNGWLLLLPAAVLLVTFTHYPAVATFIGSFFSTPKGARPAVFVGFDNYQAMIEDPIFWQALHNNIIYAVSTIPLTIVLALFMAVTVNAKMVGRSFMRLAFFTPTVLPMIAVANIWLFFYSPGYGLADQVLHSSLIETVGPGARISLNVRFWPKAEFVFASRRSAFRGKADMRFCGAVAF